MRIRRKESRRACRCEDEAAVPLAAGDGTLEVAESIRNATNPFHIGELFRWRSKLVHWNCSSCNVQGLLHYVTTLHKTDIPQVVYFWVLGAVQGSPINIPSCGKALYSHQESHSQRPKRVPSMIRNGLLHPI